LWETPARLFLKPLSDSQKSSDNLAPLCLNALDGRLDERTMRGGARRLLPVENRQRLMLNLYFALQTEILLTRFYLLLKASLAVENTSPMNF
jgi:hypothetical protein